MWFSCIQVTWAPKHCTLSMSSFTFFPYILTYLHLVMDKGHIYLLKALPRNSYFAVSEADDHSAWLWKGRRTWNTIFYTSSGTLWCGSSVRFHTHKMRVVFLSLTVGGLRWQKKQNFKLVVFTQHGFNILNGFNAFLHNFLKKQKKTSCWPWYKCGSVDRSGLTKQNWWLLIVSDSLTTLTAEWLIPLCFNTHFCFCFLMLSLSLQLARNHAHSIKWLLFHLKLRSTWAGRCWLASGRKWSIAPCPGPHPMHSCHRKRKTICSFYDVLKEHILEGVETEGILIQLCCNVHGNWKIRSHAVPSTLIPSYSGLWFVSQRP